jgi:hypothetical protein
MGEGEMVFPKLPDASDAQAVALPFILMPYLVSVFIGEMWVTSVETAMAEIILGLRAVPAVTAG